MIVEVDYLVGENKDEVLQIMEDIWFGWAPFFLYVSPLFEPLLYLPGCTSSTGLVSLCSDWSSRLE
jgi:hypothetical protein